MPKLHPSKILIDAVISSFSNEYKHFTFVIKDEEDMDSEIHDQGYEKAKILNLEQDGSDVNVLAIVLGLTGHIGLQSYLAGFFNIWVDSVPAVYP